MKRRDFLSKTLLSAAATTGLASTVSAATPSVSTEKTTDLDQTAAVRKCVIRIAHLTDIHVKAEKTAEEGMARALRNANALSPKPDFIVNSGDCIYDSLHTTKEETKEQWTLYKTILKANNTLPVVHAIGNHDIWGWMSKTGGLQADKLYGKQWMIEELGLPKRYYSFEKANWKFIILDSVQPHKELGYTAYLDAEQYAWLENELKACAPTKHITIVSHVPILSVCAGLFYGKNEPNGDLVTKHNQMHTDFFKIKNLFKNYPNIRLCLSGHIHMQDEVKFLGITYYCNGAVSGGWWKGNFQDFPPAYAIVDYYDDGSFERHFVNY
jgi:3',5'-cyclic AMP phosphodiesterase CpdA